MYYGLDLCDEAGVSLSPGYTSAEPLYRSEAPIPIPHVGDIVSDHQRWKVIKREFEYGFTENQNVDGSFKPFSTVMLVCRQEPGK